MRTHTHTNIRILGLISLVPCEGTFTVFAISTGFLHCFPEPCLSLAYLLQSFICDLEFHRWSLLRAYCDCSFHPVWLLFHFIIRDPHGESTCFRCSSHLSPDFGIRGCSPSAPIHLLGWFQLICYFLRTGWSQHGLDYFLHPLLNKMLPKEVQKLVMHSSF